MTPGPGIRRTPLPKDFFAAGVNCGVRRYRPDLGLVYSERPAVAAGVFTVNQCAAAPVLYSRSLLPASGIRAVLTNSGQANAATGPDGVTANLEMVIAVAKEVGCETTQVLTASTGVIGPQLALGKILPAIQGLRAAADDTAENFALAIMTTDLVPKTVTTTVELSGGTVRITGICKGSGMIHPNMATMLGYLLTDAQLTESQAQTWLTEATNESFNMISVDGDTSTNDAVFLVANGATGIAPRTADDEETFRKALRDVSIVLAQSIAADGEGASKLIEVRIHNAKVLGIARQAARGITLSPLVKTAIHGEDPNWGRILARLGAENVSAEELSVMSLKMQDFPLFDGGKPVPFDRDRVRDQLRSHKVVIEVDLKLGRESATAWGCDLSKRYVDINTEYT